MLRDMRTVHVILVDWLMVIALLQDLLIGYRLFDGKGLPPTLDAEDDPESAQTKLPGSDTSVHLCFKLKQLLHGLKKTIRFAPLARSRMQTDLDACPSLYLRMCLKANGQGQTG